MEFKPHTNFILADKSFVSIIKKDIHKIAFEVGFEDARLGMIDIVVSEIISNLVKHTTEKGGELLVRALDNEPGIEIISIDKGPGMTEPTRMMQDRVSTTGTLGQGLGAIKRLSDDFGMYTLKGWGTIILSRLYLNKKEVLFSRAPVMDVRAVMVCIPGEVVCGDGGAVKFFNDEVHILGLDGLGHGKEAHKAAKEVINEYLKRCRSNSPSDVLKQVHTPAKKTRGAVGSMAVINLKNKTLKFCGVGNTAGRLVTDDKLVACISYNGIIGHTIPHLMHDKELAWDNGNVFILCSDGIKMNWDMSKYPGLFKYDNSIIAAVIHKEFCRRTDDSMVIVASIKKK